MTARQGVMLATTCKEHVLETRIQILWAVCHVLPVGLDSTGQASTNATEPMHLTQWNAGAAGILVQKCFFIELFYVYSMSVS